MPLRPSDLIGARGKLKLHRFRSFLRESFIAATFTVSEACPAGIVNVAREALAAGNIGAVNV